MAAKATVVTTKAKIPRKRRSSPEDRSRSELLSRIVTHWDYGNALPTEIDFGSLLKAYRHWVYICANKNTTAVASTPIRLYIARGIKEDNNTPKAVTKTIPKKTLPVAKTLIKKATPAKKEAPIAKSQQKKPIPAKKKVAHKK